MLVDSAQFNCPDLAGKMGELLILVAEMIARNKNCLTVVLLLSPSADDTVRDFVSPNEGSLEFYSPDGKALLKNQAMIFEDCGDNFAGTLVTVRLRCHDTGQVTALEHSSVQPFQEALVSLS